MKKNNARCPNCKAFVPSRFFTHTGGNCKRCGIHIVPDWYVWIMSNRDVIFGDQTVPMRPWDHSCSVDNPDALTLVEIYRLVMFDMGISIPFDTAKVYMTDAGVEYGYVELTSANALHYTNMQGFDNLHDALLVICGLNADAVGAKKSMAIVAANMLYYAATCACVGGNHPLELKIEREIRGDSAERFPFLQDAVKHVFERCGLVHTASVCYSRFEHPFSF